MAKTPQATLVSLTRTLDRFDRAKDIRGLRAFLASDIFNDGLMTIPALRRQHVLLAVSELMARLRRAIGPLHTEPQSKAFKWTDRKIAALKRAEQMYGDDEDIARALGLTFHAARRARLRYIGSRWVDGATTKFAKAA